jgi:mannitol-1-phosphate/altronate dehydrogenase
VSGPLPQQRCAPNAPRFLKLEEAADYLDVPVDKLVPYLKSRGKKRLLARKVEGQWEIDLEDFHDWLVNLYEEQSRKAKRFE